jgi:hypothetical protein
MFTQSRAATSLFVAGILGITGCSQGNAVNTAAPPPPPAVVLKPGVPQTPEAAVKAVLDGLKASKPVVVWDAMTSSQQASFNRFVRDLASAPEPEVWSRTVTNLKKLVVLAQTKKEFLLKSPLIKSIKQLKPEELKASWDPGVKLLQTAMNSELVDQEKMKNFDGRAFLEGTGAQFMAQARAFSHSLKNDPLKQIDEWTATVTKGPDNTATARIETANSKEELIELPLSVQDGKWTSAHFGLVQFLLGQRLAPLIKRMGPYAQVEWRDQYLSDMRRLEKVLDQLQATKTADEFQTVVSLQVLPFVLQKTVELNQKTKPLSQLELRSQGRAKATALVVIKGDHFADEPGMLELAKLFRKLASDAKGTTAGPFAVGDSTIFFVNPITDTDALAKMIHVGKTTKVDVKRNKISLELPDAPASDKATADAGGTPKPSTP